MQAVRVEESKTLEYGMKQIEFPIEQYTRPFFENMGFIFVDGGYAILPKGWSWHYDNFKSSQILVDHLGRERGKFFIYRDSKECKKVEMHLLRRYTPLVKYSKKEKQYVGFIKDNAINRIIYRYGTCEVNEFQKFLLGIELDDFLKKKFPDWKNVFAYWD